jgi:RHS repeat-associated protein
MMTGPNSTDAPVMRLIDRNGDGDFTDTTDVEQHFVNHHQGSTVLVTGKATLDPSNGNLIARAPIIAHVKYDQYGVPKFVHPADVNSDGVVDAADTAFWKQAWNEYVNGASGQTPPKEIWKGTADANEDGSVDTSADPVNSSLPSSTNADWLAFNALHIQGMAQGEGCLAEQLGNLPLYAGYWWDDAVGLYHVRHRVYRPAWGRWLQRDPLGYAPGWNLYQYVNGMPWGSVDPMGLDGHFMGDVWRSIGLNWMGEFSDDVDDGAIEVWERVTGDPYAEHSKWQMQMANMASVNSARAARAGNDRLAQSIGMSFSLEMHNATMTEDFLTDGSFAAVDMITAAVPTGWAGGKVAGLISKTAAGKAVNAFGTKIFRIAGYVTDPIKGAIIRIGKYVTDAVKRAFNKFSNGDRFVPGKTRPDLIPESWGEGTRTRGGDGWRWHDPNNKGNLVRIDEGNPALRNASQQVDHVRVDCGGKVIGPDGQPLKSAKGDVDGPLSHIPYRDWKTWRQWNQP